MIHSILITGGGSGIGAALAGTLAKRDCQVIITGSRQASLDGVASQSSNITPFAADVTNSDDQDALAEALSKLSGPRAIFHGAGYFQLGQLGTLSLADWQRSFETNVTARWALSTKCATHLNDGRILFIGSDSGKNLRIGATAYSIWANSNFRI